LTFFTYLVLNEEKGQRLNLSSILFAQERRTRKFLLDCSAPKESQAMAICSRDIKAVTRDQCFFMDFNFVCGDTKE